MKIGRSILPSGCVTQRSFEHYFPSFMIWLLTQGYPQRTSKTAFSSAPITSTITYSKKVNISLRIWPAKSTIGVKMRYQLTQYFVLFFLQIRLHPMRTAANLTLQRTIMGGKVSVSFHSFSAPMLAAELGR